MTPSEKANERRRAILAPRINVLPGLLSLSVAALISASVHTLYLLTVRRLEQADLRRSHNRLMAALRQELAVLDTTCRDWAFWKDMYEYAKTPNRRFEADNLTKAGFHDTLGLHLIGILNRDGDLIWFGYWGQPGETNTANTAAQFLKDLMTLPRLEVLAGQRQGTAGMTGYLRAPWGWTLVAARPILPGQESGEPIGFLLMGRRADDRWRVSLKKQIELDFQLQGPENAPRKTVQRGWRWNPAMGSWIDWQHDSCRLLSPFRGTWPGGLLVEMVYPREVMRSARITARSVSLILFVSVLGMFLFWMWVLRRQVRELQLERLRMEQELREKSHQSDQMREQAFALLNNTDQLRKRLERIAAEQRQMNIQMQDAVTRARVLFENAPLAALLMSPGAGIILQANQSAAELFAASSPEDLLAHHPITLSPLRQPNGEESARRWKEWERESALPRGVTFPWRCRRMDGTEFDAEMTAVAFETAERRLLLVFVCPQPAHA